MHLYMFSRVSRFLLATPCVAGVLSCASLIALANTLVHCVSLVSLARRPAASGSVQLDTAAIRESVMFMQALRYSARNT